MFLQAGFNPAQRRTGIRGWTRHVRDQRRRFLPAELRQWASGDYFWRVPVGVAWGEQCVLGSYHAFSLPWYHQDYLPACTLDRRHQRGADCARCGGTGADPEADGGMLQCDECRGEGAVMRRAA
jgi:hypothetical protein